MLRTKCRILKRRRSIPREKLERTTLGIINLLNLTDVPANAHIHTHSPCFLSLVHSRSTLGKEFKVDDNCRTVKSKHDRSEYNRSRAELGGPIFLNSTGILHVCTFLAWKDFFLPNLFRTCVPFDNLAFAQVVRRLPIISTSPCAKGSR